MATFRLDDPDFWTSEPELLRPLQEACEPFGLRIRHFVMGDPDDPGTPTAAILQMPPGYELTRHAHPCERLEVIVAGSLLVDGVVLGPGDVMASRAGEMYGPHVAGPHGCTTVEIFSSLTGNGHLIVETDDGPVAVSYR
jgi:hypothetical protein